MRRFYQGLPWALLQTPLTRFGDTAADSNPHPNPSPDPNPNPHQAEGVADASGAVAQPTAHILLRLDFDLWAWKRVRRKVAAS